jgi:DNA-binding CsgD family transcriptional regulator
MVVGTSVPVGAAVPSLARWGLSTDADLVFRTLTTFGAHTGRELAGDLGLPAQRIDEALAELRAAGAASPVADRRSRVPSWSARPVAEVVMTLRARRVRLVDRAAQVAAHHRFVRWVADRLGDAGLPVELPALRGLTSDHVRYLPTRELGGRRLVEYHQRYVRERMALNTEQAVDPVTLRVGSALDRELIARGTRVRVLSPPPADGDPVTAGFVGNPASTFVSRYALEAPMKLFIFDRRAALLRADPADPERGYLDIVHPGVVDALVQLFQRHWDTGLDPGRLATPDLSLSERELELINLLAQGHTDVTAAEQLRITSRSVTNILRRVMDRLGVENRFQLGLALGALRVTEVPSLAPLVRELESEQD